METGLSPCDFERNRRGTSRNPTRETEKVENLYHGIIHRKIKIKYE